MKRTEIADLDYHRQCPMVFVVSLIAGVNCQDGSE